MFLLLDALMHEKMLLNRLQWTICSSSTVLLCVSQVLSWQIWIASADKHEFMCISLSSSNQHVPEVNIHEWSSSPSSLLKTTHLPATGAGGQQRRSDRQDFFSPLLNQTNEQQTGYSLLQVRPHRDNLLRVFPECDAAVILPSTIVLFSKQRNAALPLVRAGSSLCGRN